MANLVREVSDLTNELLEEQWSITQFEAMQIAVKIQHNQILIDAFMLVKPSALEHIALSLRDISEEGIIINNINQIKT